MARGRALGVVGALFAVLCLLTPVGGTGRAPIPAASTASEVFSLAVPAGPHPLGHVCTTTALCPAMVRTSYDFGPLIGNASRNGTGQTIAVVVACGDPLIANDLRHFDGGFHLPPANLTIYHPQGKPCTRAVWESETALDVEWAHVAAPGASIALVVAATPYTARMLDAWNYTLNHHLARQISNSWAAFGDCFQAARLIVARAVVHGVTMVASAGDYGAWGSGPGHGTPLVPADCGKALTVGGTTLSVGGVGRYLGEAAWRLSGGGYVPLSTEPPDQLYANVSDNFSELAKPDVAAVADPATPVWIYETNAGGWRTIAGTSVGSPIWAGIAADANGWRASRSFGPLGDFDPYLYRHVYGANGTSANYTAEIHDVATGSNGWPAGPGWDPDSGIGSPDAALLVQQLSTDPAA